MKQVRIRFKEEYNECPEELVILVVPDNTTNKEIREKLDEANSVMRCFFDKDYEEYNISKEDAEIMEKVFGGCCEDTILNFIHKKYGWEYEYVTEEYDIEYIY